MHVFATIAACGSLSAAARRLSQPLTTVSRQLSLLEDHVGVSLVARTTRSLTLTVAGRRYLETCKHVLDELAGAERDIRGRDDALSGEVSITAPVVFGRLHLLPVVTRFLGLYPDVDARLHLVDRFIDLTDEGIDVAIRIGKMPDSAFVASKVGAVRLLTCAAPQYLQARGRPNDPAALLAHDCISVSGLAGSSRWSFSSKASGRRTVRINPRLEVTTAEAAIDAAVGGLGVTRVPSYQVAAALARKKLVTVLDRFDDTELPIHVVRRDVRRPSPQVRLFVEFAVAELKGRRWSAGNP